jgi:hypothetical protein
LGRVNHRLRSPAYAINLNLRGAYVRTNESEAPHKPRLQEPA